MQRKLATQVYRSALSIFWSRNWNYIHDHVYFHLARLASLQVLNGIAPLFQLEAVYVLYLFLTMTRGDSVEQTLSRVIFLWPFLTVASNIAARLSTGPGYRLFLEIMLVLSNSSRK